MAGPGSPGGPCAPAAVWKRHIVRQLRHRDRKQKALFLELVPACECAPGGSGSGLVPRHSARDSRAAAQSRFPGFTPGTPLRPSSY